MYNVYISLGSNIGNKEVNLQKGLTILDNSETVSVVDVSRFYKTEPVDYADQDWFVNAVAHLVTSLSPDDLLWMLKSVEVDMGRDLNAVRFGPRELDLDILLYGDTIFKSDQVTVPHERMHLRAFVLVPLCDLAPDAIHPVYGSSMTDLLAELKDDQQGVILLDSDYSNFRVPKGIDGPEQDQFL